MTTFPTNATITWTESPYGPTTELYWGNSTSYPFSQSVPGSGSYSVFLNFLQPNWKYYFLIWGLPGSNCHLTGGSYSSSFSTPMDSALYVTGYVLDPNKAPAVNEEVEVTCMDSIYNPWAVYASTNSVGYYSVYVGYTYGSVAYCDQGAVPTIGLVVQVLNYAIYGSSVFKDHWNETVEIWGAQTVNFVLPLNYQTGYLPVVLDFSNAPSGYSQLSVSQGTGYDNSYTYSWSAGASVIGIGGGASGSTTTSNDFSVSTTYSQNGGSLCYAEQFIATGVLEFMGKTRQWAYSLTLFDPFNGNFCADISGFTIPTDWITPGSSNSYYLDGPAGSVYVNGYEDVGLWNGQSISVQVTISSTTTTTTGVNFNFGLSGNLFGVIPLSFSASESWSQSTANTKTLTYSWTITGPGSAASCFDVLGEGGSASADTADFVSIIYWQGTFSNGVPYCVYP